MMDCVVVCLRASASMCEVACVLVPERSVRRACKCFFSPSSDTINLHHYAGDGHGQVTGYPATLKGLTQG